MTDEEDKKPSPKSTNKMNVSFKKDNEDDDLDEEINRKFFFYTIF